MMLNPSNEDQVVRESGADAWEALCEPKGGCGTACCFFNGSPCEHLELFDTKRQAGRCRIYDHRFGTHRTVDGQAFHCVPMMNRLQITGLPHPQCGYACVTSMNGKPVAMGSS